MAGAAALVSLLSGCTPQARADPAGATPADLGGYPRAELLRLLPTEEQPSEHLITPGRYSLNTLPRMASTGAWATSLNRNFGTLLSASTASRALSCQ
ncbi:hypothetical protein [Paeniglutamicibacter cryotolerans]|uniref:Uncharacterized protein n=1 Tax=Paeniglutamicibacter cryotolerans TaxID=670079 RepID=A0A839QP77_9MICC|nr:hypothetical protein [Paeniglutamicibacter cryotolerans]MBB2996445.1 hypothetical protein [Paeniglutamicibacter cryotolerans]